MENIREVLAQLSHELQRAEDVDIEAREILKALHVEVAEIEKSDSTALASVHERIKVLESKFAATHPLLERLARELADAIAKMGI